MVLASWSANTPPAGAADGVSYAVVSEAWAGQDGDLATFANGGCVFATLKRGRCGFVSDESAMVVQYGTSWLEA